MTTALARPHKQTRPGTPARRYTTADPVVMIGCLQALVVANLIQVAAAFAGADPSPPAEVVPSIAATALIGIAAIPMVRSARRLGYLLGIAFCLISMVGMGPHKLFLADGATIAPMAIIGFGFEVLFIVHAARAIRERP